ncbi:MAG: leucine-rich repeat domain-containing protein [Ignavibacteria bacterium]|jgi:Leucine-rich repeat (LRR) protein|nr:leucine-rich repeat domain-containing protein [Ignavibacteria bacterium]
MKKNIFIILIVLVWNILHSDCFSQVNSAKSSGLFFDTQNLSTITELNLSLKDINTLPAEVFEMKNLQILDISNNYLSTVPAEIMNLKELKVLMLYGNNIYELPLEISRLKFLKEIYLDYYIWCYRLDEVRTLTNARIILVQ